MRDSPLSDRSGATKPPDRRRLLAERHAERRLGRIAGEEHLAAVSRPGTRCAGRSCRTRGPQRPSFPRSSAASGTSSCRRSHHRQEAGLRGGSFSYASLRGNLGAEGDRLRREGRVVRGVRLGPCDELAADGHLGQKAITRARPRVFLIGGDHAGRDDRLGVVLVGRVLAHEDERHRHGDGPAVEVGRDHAEAERFALDVRPERALRGQTGRPRGSPGGRSAGTRAL